MKSDTTAELYSYLRAGELLSANPPGEWAELLKFASSETFTPEIQAEDVPDMNRIRLAS